MIVRELYMTRADGVNLYRTYSDANLLIRKIGTNERYPEAIDVENATYTYEETNKLIEKYELGEDKLREGISDKEFRQIVEEAL